MSCETQFVIRRPPDAPTASSGRPSRMTMAGVMLLRPNARGRKEFGCPGRGSNHHMPSFQQMPVPPGTISDPQAPPSVLVSDTNVPSPSAVHRCVVDVSPFWRSRSRSDAMYAQGSPGLSGAGACRGSINAARARACALPVNSAHGASTVAGSPMCANRSACASRDAQRKACSRSASVCAPDPSYARSKLLSVPMVVGPAPPGPGVTTVVSRYPVSSGSITHARY